MEMFLSTFFPFTPISTEPLDVVGEVRVRWLGFPPSNPDYPNPGDEVPNCVALEDTPCEAERCPTEPPSSGCPAAQGPARSAHPAHLGILDGSCWRLEWLIL